MPVKVAVQWAIDTAFDLWQILHPAKPVAAMTNTQRSWQKPPPGWLKCNVDASFHAGNRNMASGVVLRDENGRMCGGKADWYDHCLNALMVEAMACRDGLTFAPTRGVWKLQLETDCQVLINLWTNRTSQNSEINPVGLINPRFIMDPLPCNSWPSRRHSDSVCLGWPRYSMTG